MFGMQLRIVLMFYIKVEKFRQYDDHKKKVKHDFKGLKHPLPLDFKKFFRTSNCKSARNLIFEFLEC